MSSHHDYGYVMPGTDTTGNIYAIIVPGELPVAHQHFGRHVVRHLNCP